MALDEKLSRADQLLISTAIALVIPSDNEHLLIEILVELLDDTSSCDGHCGDLVSACEYFVNRYQALQVGGRQGGVDDARFAVRSRLQEYFFNRVGTLYDAWRAGSVG